MLPHKKREGVYWVAIDALYYALMSQCDIFDVLSAVQYAPNMSNLEVGFDEPTFNLIDTWITNHEYAGMNFLEFKDKLYGKQDSNNSDIADS